MPALLLKEAEGKADYASAQSVAVSTSTPSQFAGRRDAQNDIELAELLDRLCDHRLDLHLLAHIALDRDRLRGAIDLLLDRLDGALSCLLVDVCRNNVSALLREDEGRLKADTAAKGRQTGQRLSIVVQREIYDSRASASDDADLAGETKRGRHCRSAGGGGDGGVRAVRGGMWVCSGSIAVLAR